MKDVDMHNPLIKAYVSLI